MALSFFVIDLESVDAGVYSPAAVRGTFSFFSPIYPPPTIEPGYGNKPGSLSGNVFILPVSSSSLRGPPAVLSLSLSYRPYSHGAF